MAKIKSKPSCNTIYCLRHLSHYPYIEIIRANLTKLLPLITLQCGRRRKSKHDFGHKSHMCLGTKTLPIIEIVSQQQMSIDLIWV